jgi:hypothetical protein
MASSTGSSVKRRIVLAVDITSQTSLLAAGIGAPFWTPVRGRTYCPQRSRFSHYRHHDQLRAAAGF